MLLTTPIERARSTIRSAWSDRDKAATQARSRVIEPVRSSKAAAIAVGGAALAGVAGLYVLVKRSLGGKPEQPDVATESTPHEPASPGNGRPTESEATKATAK